MKPGPLFAGLGIALSLTLGPSPTTAAPDDTLGMALMGAYLGPDGSVRGQSGVIAASRAGTGDYRITFDRDVSHCILSGVAGQASLVWVTAYVMDGVDVRLVRVVAFYQSTGSTTDVPVHVMAFCPQ